MFNRLTLENLAAFQRLEWHQHQRLNLLIGDNDTGKTYLLKILYCIVRGIEEYQRTDQVPPRAWQEVLSNKLLWTFQPPAWKLSQLIFKGQSRLQVTAGVDTETLHLALEEQTDTEIAEVSELTGQFAEINALFIPPKEVLTAFAAIAATREQLEIAGFDDTYFDLLKALRLPLTKGKIQENLQAVLNTLNNLMVGGQIRLDQHHFVFERSNQQYSMSQTAEGIKKIGIFDTLIRNRKLKTGSILFIDEPEVNLHPKAIVVLVDMLFQMAQAGIQIYIATHSYFVLKRFELLARLHNEPISLCSLSRTAGAGVTAEFYDLREGMPPNSIIDVSIELYEQEVRLDIEL